MGATYKTRIKNATTHFELSCLWEEIRDAYYNKKSISYDMKEKRSQEIDMKRREIRKEM